MKALARLTFGLLMVAGLGAQAKGPILTPEQDSKEPVAERIVASDPRAESVLGELKVQGSGFETDQHPMFQRMWMKEFFPHGPKI